MKQRKIVIIRGLVTAGKTTTSYELARNLPDWIFIDIWKIKEMFEPLGLKDRTPLKMISKKAIMSLTRDVMNQMGINIIFQESSQDAVRTHLKKELKRHNYKVYSFFLDVDDKDVVRRDRQREKPTMGLEKDILSGKFRDNSIKPAKEDVVINTSHNSIKKVIDIILREVGENRKKHLHLRALRKSW